MYPPGTVLVAITATGDLQGRPPVRRDGARPGELVAVRGHLGRSGGGLHLLLHGRGRTHLDPPLSTTATEVEHAAEELCRVHRSAGEPPWRCGPVAAHAGATAMIDVSDGLVRDLRRVADASGVCIELCGDALAEIAAGPLTTALGADEALRQVLSGGEEHALVASFPDGDVPQGWRVIGAVAEARGGVGEVQLDGRMPDALGWDHFAG